MQYKKRQKQLLKVISR